MKNCCKGLLLPGERKSIELMAGRLDPGNIEPMRQSLHHLVAKAPWSDGRCCWNKLRNYVLPAMQKQGPWWPGSWMTPAFRRKVSIPLESRVSTAVK